MKIFQKKLIKSLNEKAYTILELLIVLAIVGVSMGLMIYGVIKFRQVILTSNTAKEITLQLRKARRYAINNVVSSDGYATRGYYIYFKDNDYLWGECSEQSTACDTLKSVKSGEYEGIKVSACEDSSGNEYRVIKFNHVTGEIFLFQEETNVENNSLAVSGVDSCIITVELEGAVGTKKEIKVSVIGRTIKIL